MSLPGWPVDSDPKPIFGDRDEFEAGLAADITEAGHAELLTDEAQSRIVERYTDEALGFNSKTESLNRQSLNDPPKCASIRATCSS